MSLENIRKKYLEFFAERGHAVIPSASLIPEKDITTLFTGSGMQPLLQYFLGKEHPLGKRLVNSQKCFRTEDIEEVGDNRHTTFFEMLGNWSLGDYFKEEQLQWIFEFLTDEIKLKPEKLYVTVFAGDEKNGIPRDDESVGIWKKLFKEKGIEAKDIELLTEEHGGEIGMQGGRIFYYDSGKNWWSRVGRPDKMPAREPGGPDSEIFYEFENVPHDKKFGKNCHPNCDCGRFMEIGNSVFMEYVKNENGGFDKLEQRNVDFGGGLERIAAASNNDPDVFKIDVFTEMKKTLPEPKVLNLRKERIILDHLRASAFLIADEVQPSNKGQGYVLRRLLRRMAFHYFDLFGRGSHPEEKNLKFIYVIDALGKIYEKAYPEFYVRIRSISTHIIDEIDKFEYSLEMGLKEFRKLSGKGKISGQEAFTLFSTYGFPYEMAFELAEEQGIEINKVEFEAEMKKHQEVSRAGAEKKFGGHGLILSGELKAANEEELKKVTRLHTATHMLQQALREVLGPEVKQMGSDITPERTRFDFAFSRKLTPEEIKAVEDKVNKKIKKDLPMQKIVLSKAEAEKTGALYFFKEKYPDPVNVYFVGNTLETAWSKEFCGGPHVTHTGEIGKFKIIKEEAVGSGVRRIRAVVEP